MGLKSFEHRVCGVTRLPQPDQCLRKVEAFTFFPLRIARTVLRSRPYRSCSKPLSPGTLYFHAQYRQATPAHSWISDWSSNGDPKVNYRPNLSGEDNYVWLEARGQGHFVGVTMPILQNQDGWWGEGDDLFFIDGESRPSINGTGFEDYFLDAWGFGSHSFGYGLYGAPVKGSEQVNGRASVYRFHLDSPIPFTKSLRATIEHGHANHRSDNLFSVAYWSPLSLQSTTASRASFRSRRYEIGTFSTPNTHSTEE